MSEIKKLKFFAGGKWRDMTIPVAQVPVSRE